MFRLIAYFLIIPTGLWAAFATEGEVLNIDAETRSLEIELSKPVGSEFSPGERVAFRVSPADLEIGYLGRRIEANAAFYNKAWHLEQIFPINGEGAEAAAVVNRILHRKTAAMKRGRFLREGASIPNFALIDQDGSFFQIDNLKGKPFVLNFIFTRCAAPKMCPASSTKMEKLQEAARRSYLEDLHFVTISFDPTFDSPAILRSYAEGYGMELENWYLLTGKQQVVDDLLRQFGILTIEENGTINHTMTTLLINAAGEIAYREEGPSWKVDAFLEAAKKL